MVACPFEIPAYDFHEPLTPQVRKCTFCLERLEDGKMPGCASICPTEASPSDGARCSCAWPGSASRGDPARYENHVYGRTRGGGTSWLYIAGQPMAKLGFPAVPDEPLHGAARTIQHALFSYLWSPACSSPLALTMKTLSARKKDKE
jgi:hypothetical protein